MHSQLKRPMRSSLDKILQVFHPNIFICTIRTSRGMEEYRKRTNVLAIRGQTCHRIPCGPIRFYCQACIATHLLLAVCPWPAAPLTLYITYLFCGRSPLLLSICFDDFLLLLLRFVVVVLVLFFYSLFTF